MSDKPYICKKLKMEQEDTDGFYERLREKLLESTQWPSTYLYKFIVPTVEESISQIHEIFDNTGAVIESKKSKNGNYTSLSITVHLDGPDQVIAKYREVSIVEGVISL